MKHLPLAALLLVSLVLAPVAATVVCAKPNSHNVGDCLFCHRETPKFGVDTRQTVTFKDVAADDPAMCLRCHKPEENLHPLGVKPGASATPAAASLPLGSSAGHEGTVVCTTCHFVHAAFSDFALLRGFPGSQEPKAFSRWQELCRACHGGGLEKRSPHQGDDKSCVFCHQASPKKGQRVTVAPVGERLCNFCHGGLQNEHFAKANPFGAEAGCLSCHDPHLGADRPGRLTAKYLAAAKEAVTVDPHFRRALCAACHREEKGYPLLTTDVFQLCQRCHGSGRIPADAHPLRKPAAGMTIPPAYPLTAGSLTCLSCHLAGHPDQKTSGAMFLRGGPYAGRNDICFQCHAREAFREKNPHQDIGKMQGCEFCHVSRPTPGKETAATVRLVGDVAILCIRCHDENPHPSGVEHNVLLDAQHAAAVPKELPLDKSGKINCSTCHNPHLAEVENHKLRGGMSGMEICGNCHRM